MDKINIELNNLNKIDEDFIDGLIENGRGVIKVTTETYYEVYKGDAEQMDKLAVEWFETYANGSHAYRDGSRIPYENLVKVEVLKRENK